MPSPRQSAAPPPFEQSRDFVQSLARGLSVLAAFDAEHPTLSLAGIATRTGLSRAAARRLVLTLQHLGYVRPLGREFSLSPRVLELGFGCLSSLKLTDLAQPLVEQLAQRLVAALDVAYEDPTHGGRCSRERAGRSRGFVPARCHGARRAGKKPVVRRCGPATGWPR